MCVPLRDRLNMKRSPVANHGEQTKQQRVIENCDGYQVMIGEVHVNA